MIRKNAKIGDMRRTLADVLPEDLKELRETYIDPKTKSVGLSFKDAAILLGVKEITLRKYESGEIVPSITILTKMSDVYGVDFLISALRKHPLVEKDQGAV